MHKLKNKVLSTLLIIGMSAGCFASSPVYAEESAETVMDVSEVGTGTTVEHTHIYQTYYDDQYHWEQCIVCGVQRGKASHTLSGNGGVKTLCENGYYNNAYREVCNCGYQSVPYMVIHGRYSNYKNCQTLNYGYMAGAKLTDIKQITRAEYQSISYPALPGGEAYSWEDPDGDGYGWVFCGGPVMADGNGVIGTVQMIVGSEGDCGRKSAFDEYYSLSAYINSDASPSRAGFVSYLANRINSSANRSRHALYGYDTKYSTRVSDAQFSQLAAVFKGYVVHPMSYGWGTMCIRHDSHLNPGGFMYGSYSCYDSSTDKAVGYSAGSEGTCDVCGSHAMGNEDYVNDTWLVCNAGNEIKDGQRKTCAGHPVYGAGNTLLGTVYCTFQRTGHMVTRTIRAVPESGGTSEGGGTTWTANADGSITDTPITCTHTNQKYVSDYDYIHYVRFTKGGISRGIHCGYYFIRIDDTAPTPYGYTDILTANNYWMISGNGASGNISTNARIRVTFSDPDQYSQNTMSVRILDSDGNTVIKQANGDASTPLTRIGGTPGSAGGMGIWQGTVDICAEVNGTKLIFLQGIDATGNVSEPVPMQIQYMDAKGPEIKVVTSNNLDKWSKEKTFTVTATDTFGTVYLGTGNEDLKLVSNDAYKNTRTYVVKGDLADEKSITFYARDGRGNVSYKTVKFSKLDNTPPKFLGTKVTDVFENGEAVAWKMAIGGSDSESGLVGIAITKSMMEPDQTAYKRLTEVIIPRSGVYYVWIKDNVGNVAMSGAIRIHSDLEYNGMEVNEVEYNGVKLNYFYYGGKRLRL